jgi:hypothetical protein
VTGPSGAGPRTAGAQATSLAASFARASEAAGGVSVADYVIGGFSVSLRFAGRAFHERVTPAFAHLAAAESERAATPNLTISLWDSASTGVEPPPRPRTSPNDAPGTLYHFHEPPLRGAYQAGQEALSVFDAEAGVAWYWVANVFDLPWWEQASPIRQILFWWLGSRGYLQVHGAAVGTEEGGVLVVGQAGSGKSTVALACLGSDLLYAGDDYVAVALEPPRVASLYNSGKLDWLHLHERLPHLLPVLANSEDSNEEKAVLNVQQHFPDQTTSGFQLAALLVPTLRPERQAPSLVPGSREAAFTALGPSTILQLHTAGAGEFATLSSLVASLPCYSLELGSDLSAIPEAISELLSTL